MHVCARNIPLESKGINTYTNQHAQTQSYVRVCILHSPIMFGALTIPDVPHIDSMRTTPDTHRKYVDMMWLRDDSTVHRLCVSDVLSKIAAIERRGQITQCDFERDLCPCCALSAIETCTDPHKVVCSYCFFFGRRWRFFHELCRQSVGSRCLYEVYGRMSR